MDTGQPRTVRIGAILYIFLNQSCIRLYDKHHPLRISVANAGGQSCRTCRDGRSTVMRSDIRYASAAKMNSLHIPSVDGSCFYSTEPLKGSQLAPCSKHRMPSSKQLLKPVKERLPKALFLRDQCSM